MSVTVESVFRDQQQFCEEVASDGGTRADATRLVMISALGLSMYGFAMGFHQSILQSLMSAIKLPFLYFFTSLITFPAFHFISLYLGSRTKPTQTLLVCLNGAAVVAVLAGSFSPIALFFTLSGSSYSFLVLMHVSILAFCSIAGASTIEKNLRDIRKKTGEVLPKGAGSCFFVWVFMCAIVGTQLAWMMRPFVGSSDTFTFINTDKGNFYEAVFKSLIGLLGG